MYISREKETRTKNQRKPDFGQILPNYTFRVYLAKFGQNQGWALGVEKKFNKSNLNFMSDIS